MLRYMKDSSPTPKSFNWRQDAVWSALPAITLLITVFVIIN